MRTFSRPQRPWRDALRPDEAAEIERLDALIEHHENLRTEAARARHKIQCRASHRAGQRADAAAIQTWKTGRSGQSDEARHGK